MSLIPSKLAKLPLAPYIDQIEDRLANQKHLLLTAPTGTGKSTFLPWLLHNGSQKVIVLQPRRIAAIGLSQYLSQCLKQEVGNTIGYMIRFESKCSPQSKIIYQTYGSFLQSALHQNLSDLDWIVFDEFHERTIEIDLLLSWLINNPQSKIRIAVLSAELNREHLESILQVPCLPIADPGYPVQIIQQESKSNENLTNQVLRAYRTLYMHGFRQTYLIFLPGKGEINSIAEYLHEQINSKNEPVEILQLFGGQEYTEQAKIFENTSKHRIILTTNIAETSLTIPNVTAVIDSGLERIAEYDSSKNLTQLRLNRISLQNAIQRKGRAGRTQTGTCIRLWSEKELSNLQKEITPEILRIQLNRPLLLKAGLAYQSQQNYQAFPWLTQPKSNDLAQAEKELADLQLLVESEITAQGLESLSIPVQSLAVANFLLQTKHLTPLHLACAVIIDSGSEISSRAKQSLNLLDLAQELLEHSSKQFSRDINIQLQRLKGYFKIKLDTSNILDLKKDLLKSFPQSRASIVESKKAYKLDENSTVILDYQLTHQSNVVLVFHLLKSGTEKIQQINKCCFVEIPDQLIISQSTVTTNWELIWKNNQERFSALCIQFENEKEFSRKEVPPHECTQEVRKILMSKCASAWKEKFKNEDLSHNWMSENNQKLLAKMHWAAQSFPDFNLPLWSSDDWELVMDEFTDSVFVLKDLNENRFRNCVEDYFGKSMLSWLHKTFPDILQMPNGKFGKYKYPLPSEGPIEISARIADFFTLKGKHTLADGKIEVRYDLLAPNYRSAQKTWDLTGFWKNTYLEIRKELRGRYPKHPWPENPLEL